MNRFELALRATLSLALLALGLAKLAVGHDPDFLLSPPVYYGAALVELALAVGLWTSARRLTALSVLALFAGGAFFAFTQSGGPGCGCFGGVAVGRHQHVLIACALGVLASTVWALDSDPRRHVGMP